VARRQKALFCASNVKANHTIVSVPYCQLGNLKASIGMSHGRYELARANESAASLNFFHASLKAILDRLDGLVESEACG
jgi:hypothetical protein